MDIGCRRLQVRNATAVVTDCFRNYATCVIGNEPSRVALGFHRAFDDYSPTALLDVPELAARLRVHRLWLKDESSRLGLPSFKILGASWATRVAVGERLGLPPNEDISLTELRVRVAADPDFALVAATDGNHGRAVARMAHLLQVPALIFVPADMASARRQAIAAEGAEVIVVDGGYDDAVRRAAEESKHGDIVISDTSWPGYEDVPRAVIDGYSSIFWEVDDELRRRGEKDPDLVVVPIGVGALAAAVARHYRRPGLPSPPILIGIEPRNAACLLASARAGRRVSLTTRQESIMAGLNCGTPSLVAWPDVLAGFDLFVEIDDDSARQGMRLLAGARIFAGECAGGAIGGARDVLTSHLAEEIGLPARATALILLTEGVTDPIAYKRILEGAADIPPMSV